MVDDSLDPTVKGSCGESKERGRRVAVSCTRRHSGVRVVRAMLDGDSSTSAASSILGEYWEESVISDSLVLRSRVICWNIQLTDQRNASFGGASAALQVPAKLGLNETSQLDQKRRTSTGTIFDIYESLGLTLRG